jgi:hypothetical protein
MTKRAWDVAVLTGRVAVGLALMVEAASAQKPTPAQLDSLRANCKGDLARVCPGVPRDGRALLCLRQNIAKLSPACAQAVNAVK